jgi:hypothetical protein
MIEDTGDQMRDGSPIHVVNAVALVRRRLGLARIQRWGVRGLGAGAVLIALTLIAGQLGLPEIGLGLALAILAAGALSGSVLGRLLRWPDQVEAARLVDIHFRLDDRITTALEFRTSEEPLQALQRRETVDRIEGLKLKDSVRGQVGRRDPALAGVAIIAALALSFVGTAASPSASALSDTSLDKQRINQAATTTIPSLLRHFEQGLAPQQRATPGLRELNFALTRLQRDLLHAPTRAAALRAISAAQQLIQQATGRRLDTSSLLRALKPYTTPTGRAQASGQNGGASAASAALSRLASGLNHLSASQRAKLARSLSKAQGAASDSRLKSALQQASSSLSRGDTRAAARALQKAAGTLKSAAANESAASRLASASNSLDSLKNSVSGMSQDNGTQPQSQQTGSQRTSSSKPGANGNEGIVQPNGLGHQRTLHPGAGKASSSGQDKIQGRANGSDALIIRRQGGSSTSSVTGPGNKTAGGTGSGGGGSSGSQSSLRYVTVFIPGKAGPGIDTTVQTSGSALPGGRLVPYQVVIARYSRAAHVALDQLALPPSLQSYVREYFSSVSK